MKIRYFLSNSPLLTWWLLCFITIGSVNSPVSADDCPTLPPLSSGLAALFEHIRDAGFQLQGAQYDKNPPHSHTFSEFVKRDPLRHLGANVEEFNDARVFPYLLDSADTTDHTLIPIPKDYFWCLLRPGMTVLLTDGVTHHYTIVYSIDQSGSFMDLLDPWPNRIFLRRGLNRKRVDAKIIEVPNKGKLVRITRDEFERVVLGAVGHEQVSFHAHLVDLVPASRKNQRFLLALAITTFGPAPQETPQPALPYFKEALDLARADAGSVLTRHIASESLYLIYVTSYLTKSDDIPELEREAIIRTLGDIAGIVQELAPDMQVASSLKEEQLIRLGQLAWEANENGESEHIFSTVIQRFPNNPAGYFGRAKAQNRLLKHTGTIDDVTHALGLLKALLDSDTIPLELKKGSSAYKILDYFDSAQERKNLHFMLTESYFLRGNAYNALGKYPEAEQDGREAIKFNPQNHQGYIVIAVSLKARDRPWEAFPYFAEASRYVPREQLALQLKQLAKQTLDTARLQNPSWKIGRLESKPSPFVPVLMGWAEAEAFFAEGGTENDTEKLYRLSSCFVPNDTLAIAMGEEQDGFIKVMIDRAFVEQLPITLAQKDQGFYCKGVVPKFIFKPILED